VEDVHSEHITYENSSVVITGSVGIPSGGTDAKRAASGSSVPPGYIGVQARLFSACINCVPRELCGANQWEYNTQTVGGIGRAINKSCGTQRNYSSQGHSKARWADGSYALRETYTTLTEYYG
jgi:hypothetical protein